MIPIYTACERYPIEISCHIPHELDVQQRTGVWEAIETFLRTLIRQRNMNRRVTYEFVQRAKSDNLPLFLR